MAEISFFVPGCPKSTQYGSVVRVQTKAGIRAFPVKRNTNWMAILGLWARNFAPSRPLTGAVRVIMQFQFLRPKGVSIRQRPYPTVRPDLDGLLKGVADSLNGVLWNDDSQIVEYSLKKVYTDEAGVMIEVERLE